MKIKQVHFPKGYKRFFDLTIDLGENPKKIVALVGPNGCGKSSVIDGIVYRVNTYINTGQSSFNMGKSYHAMDGTGNYNSMDIEILLDNGKIDEARRILRDKGRENTIISLRSPYRYNSSLNVTESKSFTEIKFNSYGARYSVDLDGKMTENYRRLNAKINKYMHDNDCRPSEAKQAVIGELNFAIKRCLDLEIQRVGDVDANEGTIFFTKTDQKNPFEFNVLSAGEKEVVDLLIDLYLRAEDYTETIFLMDEPELHINTSIQRKLIVEIDRLIGEDCQLWVSTHSIGFLKALQEELNDKSQIIQFKDGVKYGEEKHTLFPMVKNSKNWREIFEVALGDLAKMVSPKQIIYCEGIGEKKKGVENGLDAQVYNNVFSDSRHDSLFVSSGGNTELDQRSDIAIAILSKVFLDVEILVLKDRDISSGKLTTQEERTRYLKLNPDNHRVLKRLEIENYLYDKEVLTFYCQENGLTFNSDKYDRTVTDIYDQDLKESTGMIKSICGITTSVNAEKFKIDLSHYLKSDMAVYAELEDCVFNRQ